MGLTETIIFDFNEDSNLSNWSVIDDVVMGGRSNGRLFINEAHHGVFEGEVSLENNGGFSSVRHNMTQINVSDYSRFVIRLKGDGKRYQFRAKQNDQDDHSYIAYFDTDGSWETIELDFESLKPAYRGKMLDMPVLAGEKLEEVGFLIGNNKNEAFQLEIDFIKMK